jgi:hypothetical protein
MTKTLLTLHDTTQSALMKLSGGNPGALTVMLQILEHAERIDPDRFGGAALVLLHLDELGIHGPKIWMLYKDVCGESISRMMGALRAVQLGIISRETLDKAIDNYGRGLDLEAALVAVKTRLPKFQLEAADAAPAQA